MASSDVAGPSPPHELARPRKLARDLHLDGRRGGRM